MPPSPVPRPPLRDRPLFWRGPPLFLPSPCWRVVGIRQVDPGIQQPVHFRFFFFSSPNSSRRHASRRHTNTREAVNTLISNPLVCSIRPMMYWFGPPVRDGALLLIFIFSILKSPAGNVRVMLGVLRHRRYGGCLLHGDGGVGESLVASYGWCSWRLRGTRHYPSGFFLRDLCRIVVGPF